MYSETRHWQGRWEMISKILQQPGCEKSRTMVNITDLGSFKQSRVKGPGSALGAVLTPRGGEPGLLCVSPSRGGLHTTPASMHPRAWATVKLKLSAERRKEGGEIVLAQLQETNHRLP